ncbi:MAG: winged helix-turn-helix domain-containing protein [Methanoregula sp.]|nr:winged helix-turn-helix domain-containing protein [Methanoregula sp.]
MKQPFEGLFGDTCETRLLQFLLPMYGIEFDMAELVEEIGLTRQSIAKAMKKFSDRGMVKIRKDGRTWLYSINEESPLVKRLEDFDNSLIESMIGPAEFKKIENAHENQVRASSQKESGLVSGKPPVPYGTSDDAAPCVASRTGNYLSKKAKAK